MIGGHQEDGRRAGTENVPVHRRAGQGPATWPPRLTSDEETRVRGLRDRLEQAIVERIPYVEVNGRDADSPAQHAERLLPFRRGRGDPLPAERFRHLRFQRLGLHLRLAGAVARVAGDERARTPPSKARSASASAATTPTTTSTASSRSSQVSSRTCGGFPPIGTKRRTLRASARRSWSAAHKRRRHVPQIAGGQRPASTIGSPSAEIRCMLASTICGDALA